MEMATVQAIADHKYALKRQRQRRPAPENNFISEWNVDARWMDRKQAADSYSDTPCPTENRFNYEGFIHIEKISVRATLDTCYEAVLSISGGLSTLLVSGVRDFSLSR
jgi:hypothetical protein